jgi:hypothetical protein
MLTRFRIASFLAPLAVHALGLSAAFAQAPTPPTPAPAQPAAPGAPAPAAPAQAPAAPAEPAAAANPEPAAPAPAEAQPPARPKGDHSLVADAEEGNSPVERPNQTYYFVGARYRGIIVPKFMVNIFGDGGKTVWVNSFGPEFGIRKNGFEYSFGLWYAAYSMGATDFKGKSDGEDAWEIVRSKVKVVYLTADFLWSQEFTPEFALNYGLGAGFGFVFGDLHRVQAYKDASGNYQPCRGPGDPATSNPTYCGTDNDHYGNYTEANWANGGSKPIIFPWLVFQTGLRFKPHKNFASRLDLGFGTSGFFLGLAADYGL